MVNLKCLISGEFDFQSVGVSNKEKHSAGGFGSPLLHFGGMEEKVFILHDKISQSYLWGKAVQLGM